MAKITSRWAHATEITGVGATQDGSFVVTTSQEFSMNMFPQKGTKSDSSAIKVEAQEPVTCLVISKDRIYTGSIDSIVRKYDIKDPESHAVILRCDLQVRCLALSHDERLLAVGTDGPDVKIIDLEEAENCWAFQGHKKAINSLSFDPLGQFLISSSCDGTVIVWDLKSKDTSPIEIIKVMEPTTTDSIATIPVAWHPSNEFFIIGKDKDIAAHYRHTWKKSFTYRTGSSQPVRSLAWSPNGKFIAATSIDTDLWIWQYKEKDAPMLKHKHTQGGITGIAWIPNANRLVFGDTKGELSQWDDVIDADKGSPFTQPKPDPLDGLFDDAAVEDQGIEDNEMAQDYGSGDESLGDFIVEDETGTYLEKKPAGASKPTPKTQPVKELHPQIQSGSTSRRDDRRYLAFNLLGLITSVSHDTHATVSVEFHDKVAHRGFHFMDSFHYSMACLGLTGTLFAAAASDSNPSTVFYKTYDSWATKSEWQVYLPEGEDATAIALSAESAIVATSKGYVRVFSQSGIQTALFCVGSVIAAAGKDDMVLLIYHQGEPFEGSQNLGYSIYNVETGQRIQHGPMPVSDDTLISWVGFSEGGIPSFYNDKGVMFILNYYRRVDQGQWTPILDTTLMDSESDIRPHYWPIGLTDEALTCIRCRKGETEPAFPKPIVTELSLKMPTLYQDTAAGKHEEAWLRQKILSGLSKDEKMATLFERTDNVVAKKEVEMDKLALQMIDLACRADRTQKALDLTAMLCNLRSIDAAVKIAHHHNLHSLMERMNKVKEIKMLEEQEKDPNAEMEMIMANPVLAAPSAKDQNTYRISSREEEQELEKRAFQRKEAVKPNDPFGRRVVKDTNGSSRTIGGQSSTASGSSGAGTNPFKKKGGPDSAAGPKGFGAVVKESDMDKLPITRRAADVFQAAEFLAVDEQRAKAKRQEDVFRKRKANGAPTSNGGQKTLSMFGKPAAESSTSAEAKRFKRQINEDEDMEEAEDSDGGEEFGGSSVRVPATQEEELEESIEDTRNHLEKTRVEPLSPSKGSSSVLSGFKFNG
ncbi:hypothetical protein B0O80DRAFT_439828 [Mortierella sp. GBAus27b]|nr:hypothetical protein B0O80DRAFT_439828 [Mortierella sp. GBAus27b]